MNRTRLALAVAAIGAACAATADEIRDCPDCPALVETPDGAMIGKYPVTVAEFRVFAEDTGFQGAGCSLRQGAGRGFAKAADWRDPGFEQGDDHPVVCVSWNDAVAYSDWLSARTGQIYRLPSLEESVAAAAGGATTEFWWGDDFDALCANANVADAQFRAAFPEDPRDIRTCDDGHVHTAPVTAYPANGWGLHHAVGNVWTWTNSCLRGDCSNAIFRGGAWDVPARKYFQPGEYFGDRIVLTNDVIGFRVLRDTE